MAARRVGVWIDHSKAHVVELVDDETPTLHTFESEVEPRHKATGVRRSARPGQVNVAPVKRYEHRRENEKHRFYDRLAEHLRDADEILLSGPGQARIELSKHLRRRGAVGRRVRAVRPAPSRLTSAQIIARVRDFFGEEARRRDRREAVPSHTPQELLRHNGRPRAAEREQDVSEELT